MKTLNPWQSYKKVATTTASPGQLVLMLYEGAIRFLEQARTAFHCDDPLEFNLNVCTNVQKAQAIINELSLSLNMQAGGEFAANQRRLYNYLDRRLQESNLKKDLDGISEVIQRLTVIKDAWAEMLQTGAAFRETTIPLAMAG
jgi:flagellar protein FliS